MKYTNKNIIFSLDITDLNYILLPSIDPSDTKIDKYYFRFNHSFKVRNFKKISELGIFSNIWTTVTCDLFIQDNLNYYNFIQFLKMFQNIYSVT